jgi:hypothetical protein
MVAFKKILFSRIFQSTIYMLYVIETGQGDRVGDPPGPLCPRAR